MHIQSRKGSGIRSPDGASEVIHRDRRQGRPTRWPDLLGDLEGGSSGCALVSLILAWTRKESGGFKRQSADCRGLLGLDRAVLKPVPVRRH